MNLNRQKANLLAAGDIAGLIALNASIYGGFTMMAKGYHSVSDALTMSTDGRDLNEIWDEFQATIQIQNAERQRMIELLTFPVTSPIEDVNQFGSEEFEKASQYGVPVAIRPDWGTLSLGYTFDWYDKASRFTWQFLSEATAQKIEAAHQLMLGADNVLVFKEVMRTLFLNTNRTANIKNQNFNVYTFWNGDGTVPPPYKANTFDGTHTHFRASGANTIDQGDLNEIIDDFKSHGYSAENGTTMFALVNMVEANVIRSFRVSTGARYDFIPALGQPGLIIPAQDQLLGTGQPPALFRGMNVVGSYGPLMIIEEEYVPPAYVVALVSGGDADIQNPIGFREHANSSLRGLLLVKGRDNDYPLIDSYYTRGFGTGVRQRGAGIVMKITSGAYTIPTQYV